MQDVPVGMSLPNHRERPTVKNSETEKWRDIVSAKEKESLRGLQRNFKDWIYQQSTQTEKNDFKQGMTKQSKSQDINSEAKNSK